MNREATPDHISKRRVVYEAAGIGEVRVQRDVEFDAPGGVLTLDVYFPPDSPGAGRMPVVVLAAGYPDPGFQAKLGCRFKEMGSSVSWARLIAASGMAAIVYANREPAADLHALLAALRREASSLRIDETRVGVWASSGNVPLALSLLLRDGPHRVRCAALCYGYMLDLDGSTGVAEAARTFGFVNPCASRTVADLRSEAPLFIARAGRDQCPGLNDSLDRFLAAALAANLPLTFANHAAGPHAFELFDDSETSREIVRQALAFLKLHLGAARPAAPGAGE